MSSKICTGTILRLLAVILLGTVTGLSVAEEKKPAATAVKPPPVAPIIYKPPMRGAPKTRVGGGTRGPGGQETVLQVLAPDHAGLTTQSQPVLYWYVSSPQATRLQFALLDEEGIEPLLEIETGKGHAAGIQKLDLGEHNISLQPDVTYQWSVALIIDENSRSSDIVTSGVVERIEPSAELSRRVAASSGEGLVQVYADEGLWYDALQAISSLIKQSPDDQHLAAIRASLLEQVGVGVVDVVGR